MLWCTGPAPRRCSPRPRERCDPPASADALWPHGSHHCLAQIQRAALYLADEVFFTGTAAEITPIRSVDRITVGSGRRGEMTKRFQEEFFKIIRAERPAPFGANWLTFVNDAGEKKTAVA